MKLKSLGNVQITKLFYQREKTKREQDQKRLVFARIQFYIA